MQQCEFRTFLSLVFRSSFLIDIDVSEVRVTFRDANVVRVSLSPDELLLILKQQVSCLPRAMQLTVYVIEMCVCLVAVVCVFSYSRWPNIK